jgi:hypothetical protein
MIAASSATKDAMPHERALQRGLRVGGDGAARSQRRRGQIYRRRKSSITNRSASPHARQCSAQRCGLSASRSHSGRSIPSTAASITTSARVSGSQEQTSPSSDPPTTTAPDTAPASRTRNLLGTKPSSRAGLRTSKGRPASGITLTEPVRVALPRSPVCHLRCRREVPRQEPNKEPMTLGCEPRRATFSE